MIVALSYVEDDPGHVYFLDYEGNVVDTVKPANLMVLDERPSYAYYRRGDKSRLFISGGTTDNCMVTDQRNLLRNHMAPIRKPMVLSGTPADNEIGLTQAAGAGLTGDCIFFLRWRDSLNDLRSGLSAGSPTMTLNGSETVTFANVPARPNPEYRTVDKIEVWVSRNGSDIRRLATRDAGASTFDITEAIEYEAETVRGLGQAPRCRFNAIYHERLWQAGDIEHPDRIYFSPIERLNEWNGGYLATRNGEAVTGIATVRDVLAVFCAKSSYYITGYSEGDFQVASMEPNLGCLTHHGIAKVHDLLFVPGQKGVYACTGNSMSLLAGDYTTLWSELYETNPLNFETGFAVNDERGKVYKFKEEDWFYDPGEDPEWYINTYGRTWVFDYKDFSQQEGGGFAPPHLSFDIYNENAWPTAAAMIATPGGKSGNCFTTFPNIWDGVSQFITKIVQENNYAARDVVGTRNTVIQTPMIVSEPGGGPNDGLTFIQGWQYVLENGQTDPASWNIECLHGPNQAAVKESIDWALAEMLGLPLAGAGKSVTAQWGNWAATYELVSLTLSGTTVTGTTLHPHNLSDGVTRTIAGAVETDYNGDFVLTVTSPTTFTYDTGGPTPTSPATTLTKLTVTGDVTSFSPEAVPFKMQLTGEGMSMRFTATDPLGLIWSGYGFVTAAGKKFLAPKA